MSKKYFVVTLYDGWDKLYTLSKTKEKQFEKLFGKFDSVWNPDNHDDAVDWLVENGTFVSKCSVLAKG